MGDCYLLDTKTGTLGQVDEFYHPVAPGALPLTRVGQDKVIVIGQWSKEIALYDHWSSQISTITKLKI